MSFEYIMVVHMVWFYCHYRVMFLKEIWSWGIHLLSQFMCALSLRCVWLFAITWTVACQAPLSMEFPRQEHWRGLPSPPPGDHQPRDWTQVFCIAGGFFTVWATREAHYHNKWDKMGYTVTCRLSICWLPPTQLLFWPCPLHLPRLCPDSAPLPQLMPVLPACPVFVALGLCTCSSLCLKHWHSCFFTFFSLWLTLTLSATSSLATPYKIVPTFQPTRCHPILSIPSPDMFLCGTYCFLVPGVFSYLFIVCFSMRSVSTMRIRNLSICSSLNPLAHNKPSISICERKKYVYQWYFMTFIQKS